MSKQVYRIVGTIGVVAILIILIIAGYNWFVGKQERVANGTARATFPYSDYSIEELNKIYPQNVLEGVVTTRSPEETHRMFIEKLTVNDIEGALSCCVVQGAREEIRETIDTAKNKGMYNVMLGDIGRIEADFVGDGMATYLYTAKYRDATVTNFMRFVKNQQGIWLIKSF